MDRLAAEIIVDYANEMIEDDDFVDPQEAADCYPIWPKVQQYFKERYGIELNSKPRDNEYLSVDEAGNVRYGIPVKVK